MTAGTRRAVVRGSGSALPVRRVSNAELAETVDTSDAWIVERTGIRFRHIAGAGETTATLATDAARRALAAAGIDARDVDLIVLATATPDQTFPATATKVQAALGVGDCVAFDVQAVCSGFLYAMSVADSMIRAGSADTALVIGAETFSRILDWEDRGTCVLFGDGAGAFVLQGETSADTPDRAGILAVSLHADGRHNDLLYVDGGPSTTGTVGKLRMKGPEVFKHAVTNLAAVLREVLDRAALTIDDVDWIVPHQANRRILDATARKLGLSADRIVVTVDIHANTSAASVPLAFDVAVRDGRIGPGDSVVFEAMGGGFTGARRRFDYDMRCGLVSVPHPFYDPWGIFDGDCTYDRRGYAYGADISDRVHGEIGLSRADAARIVEQLLADMCGSLARGENVKISGFGSFVLRDKGERVGRNPKTGVEVPIAPRRVLTFRASQITRERIARGG